MHKNNGSKLKLILPCNNDIHILNNYISLIHSFRNHISRFKQWIDRIKSDVYLWTKELKFYEKNIKEFESEIDKLYLKAEEKIKSLWYINSLDNLSSIPTISRSLSIELLILFINLKSKWIESNDRSKLKAYVWIDPTEKRSWTALNRVSISRRWKKHIRVLLYMSWMKWYQLINYDKYAKTDLWNFFVRMRNKFSADTTNKRWKSIITAMSKKILLTAWWIFWNETKYNWS